MHPFSKMKLRQTLASAALGICSALLSVTAQAQAQSYPNKPIRFIVPYSAGTTTDVIARVYAQKLGEVLGQNVLVDNKAGAGGNIASEYVARSAPDGYTLTFSTSATVRV